MFLNQLTDLEILSIWALLELIIFSPVAVDLEMFTRYFKYKKLQFLVIFSQARIKIILNFK